MGEDEIMSLTTLSYLIFLTVCVLCYHMLPVKISNFWLLLSSVAFSAYALPKQTLIMMVYVWVIFIIGVVMGKAKKSTKGLLVLGICISIGFLFAYKYLNFSIHIFAKGVDEFSLIAPIGISYVTFQCISYLVEIHKGKLQAVRNPRNFFLYCFFFPKITAGPIEPPETFFENIKKRTLKWSNLSKGIMLIALGFLKKMVVADALAIGVNKVYANPSAQGGESITFAIILYSLQIYYDFAGYTDIARGSACLFGIDLVENFRKPYGATSIQDFWRKWHISLSEWLKKYIYFSLGGSRVGTVRKYVNVLITFLVSGIWHGASVTFIVWGLMHGILQVVGQIFEPIKTKMKNAFSLRDESLLVVGYCRMRTFILVSLAWVFFRAESLSKAIQIIKGIFKPWESVKQIMPAMDFTIPGVLFIVFGILFAKLVENYVIPKKLSSPKVVMVASALSIVIMMALVVNAGAGAVNSFIYFDF